MEAIELLEVQQLSSMLTLSDCRPQFYRFLVLSRSLNSGSLSSLGGILGSTSRMSDQIRHCSER